MTLFAQIQLTPVDYACVAIYAIIVIGLGLWFSREQKTSTDYILAGRSMGWIAVGISQLASLLSAISYLGNPGEAYAHDASYLFYSLCGYLSVPIAIVLFLNFFYRLQITSIYEYLEKRFNNATRTLASLIFIGTPHCGSDLANRPIGWLGSALVKETPQQKARREQLARDNPGLFRGDLINHAPTSIELLKPDSPLLAATNRLPYKPGILIHSIVGAGDWTLGEGPSDGVVAVKSSRLYGVCSEKVVYANHEGLQRDDETVREVARILFEHLRLCDEVPGSRLSR